MNMYFREGDKEAYVSHTRVKLPKYKDELTLVLVYGLSEENAMMLLTNKKVKDKRDVHQVVRAVHKKGWARIEEGFRFKKTEYGFEKMLLKETAFDECAEHAVDDTSWAYCCAGRQGE